jgi:hypothetical protein
MTNVSSILKAVAPHGLIEFYRDRRAERVELARAEFHAERHRRIAAAEQEIRARPSISGDDYEKAIAFLVARGLSETEVRQGSIRLASLRFPRQHVFRRFGSCPTKALHVGNFVGVSLVFLAESLVSQNTESLVVSIDPNLCCLGIINPQQHASALISACGLQRNVMIIAGYPGRKSVSNDGVVHGEYDPQHEFNAEAACEESLQNLSRLCLPRSFDIVMMDGNHDADYLVTEIQHALPLIKPRGFLILDDVGGWWAEIGRVFKNIHSLGFNAIATDGRVGVAQATA